MSVGWLFLHEVEIGAEAKNMNGTRGTEGVQVQLGLIVPLILLVLVSINACFGTVWGPAGRHSRTLICAYTEPVVVFSLICLKCGAAIALFGWYWCANQPKLFSWVATCQITAIVLAVIGLLGLAGLMNFVIFFEFA